ncbi:hypothetical protein [Cupriavidus pauculus]|uniref:hypothetical protein n=1 Tax=Cupriavidus pauculus TaxID=82633 RepID=UPI0015DF14FD|nr:hypothetical protein [Cupriavidus pauculus]
MNAVSFVGYALAFLAVIIIAARWIYRNHPALRDADPVPPDRREGGAHPPRGGSSRD